MIYYLKMVEVIFDYKQIKTVIQANLNDSFRTIINNYINKTHLDLANICFIANGKNINENEIINNIMNKSEKLNKKKLILVHSKNNIINNVNNYIIQSNDIICPTCKEICKFDINNYKIKLYGCKNGHIIDNIKLDEFKNKQNLDISKIKCGNCKDKSKSDTFNNEFFICHKCNMNLCPLCKSIHDKTHSIINYDNKNYICNKHNELYMKYCEDCKIDLCFSCINEHKNHKQIPYEDNLLDIKKLREKMDNLNTTINKFKANLEEIINKFKKLQENLDLYYNINNNIINNYEKNKKRNYNLLVNLNNINKNIDSEISKLLYEYNYGNNLNKLIYLYNEINDENLEIEIKYNPIKDKKEKLEIFGDIFINNNIYKCKIIYNNKEYDLTKYIDDIDKEYNSNDIVIIKLKGYNNITDMSFMFNNCTTFFSLPDLSKWNTSNVYNMCYMFNECKTLPLLPDISNWNISNVISIESLFRSCDSLSSLPDISKWDTTNVKSMGALFAICKSLSSLPDISKWNTSNVENMAFMFSWCMALRSLPDISKWNTSNVKSFDYMFICCATLSSLPDISKWNTSSVTGMNNMFSHCGALSSLPDITKWDISNVKDMDNMFGECKSSLQIPPKFKK